MNQDQHQCSEMQSENGTATATATATSTATQEVTECHQQRMHLSEEAYKELLTQELEKKGSSGAFVWLLFTLCISANVLNGFHISSYVMLGPLPNDQWCGIPLLEKANWSLKDMRTVAEHNLNTKGCTVWNWDYEILASMEPNEAIDLTRRIIDKNPPVEVPCERIGYHRYDDGDNTFVAEWDLICERSIDRTSSQAFLSLGKFLGSFSFGIFSDRYGRRPAFALGAAFYVVASVICTVSPWYNLFLLGRLGLGAASSGLFYPAFTILVENLSMKHRSWMSIAFSGSYPVGILILALFAYFIDDWRYLQLALTLPSFLLVLNLHLLPESPRWLITKGQYERVYRYLFNDINAPQVILKENELTEINVSGDLKKDKDNKMTKTLSSRYSLWIKLIKDPLQQFGELYATPKLRRLISTSYFMFCTTSLCYYVTALNAANLDVSRYLYVAITGLVDLPSYLVPVVMLRFTGRKITTMSLFLLTSVALLLMLVVSQDNTKWIVSFAMLGRFGITATYSVLTLYTAELYPTEIRNSALGTCSTWAHVGSISAPYAVDLLGPLVWYLPTTVCGGLILLAALLTLSLPETGTGHLTDHVDKVESSQNSKHHETTKDIKDDKLTSKF